MSGLSTSSGSTTCSTRARAGDLGLRCTPNHHPQPHPRVQPGAQPELGGKKQAESPRGGRNKQSHTEEERNKQSHTEEEETRPGGRGSRS
eukprot:3021393-Rhodomonas_salina.1